MKSEERIVKSTKKKKPLTRLFFLEVTVGFEPTNNGVADRGLTTWLRHPIKFYAEHLIFVKKQHPFEDVVFTGADYGARTRHLNLGKVALYQMS